MKYIKDIKENERIVEHYLCAQKQVMKTKAGKTYFSIMLQDKTGTVNAKVWDITNDIHDFNSKDYIKIDATSQIFNDEIQLRVTKLRKSNPGEFDPGDYMPITQRNIATMSAEIKNYISSINNKFIADLLKSIFYDENMFELFSQNSAGKSMHHSYIGGLIEHTLSVVEICDFMQKRTRFVNRDILICSALLHDIGKIYELSAFPINDYTDAGELIGHIVMGANLISQKASQIPDFPEELKNSLMHCILSHHGEYEYGSPKLPKTMEALILHFADDMDAKLKMFEEAIDSDTTSNNWTAFNKVLARRIMKPNENV